MASLRAREDVGGRRGHACGAKTFVIASTREFHLDLFVGRNAPWATQPNLSPKELFDIHPRRKKGLPCGDNVRESSA